MPVFVHKILKHRKLLKHAFFQAGNSRKVLMEFTIKIYIDSASIIPEKNHLFSNQVGEWGNCHLKFST